MYILLCSKRRTYATFGNVASIIFLLLLNLLLRLIIYFLEYEKVCQLCAQYFLNSKSNIRACRKRLEFVSNLLYPANKKRTSM